MMQILNVELVVWEVVLDVVGRGAWLTEVYSTREVTFRRLPCRSSSQGARHSAAQMPPDGLGLLLY